MLEFCPALPLLASGSASAHAEEEAGIGRSPIFVLCDQTIRDGHGKIGTSS